MSDNTPTFGPQWHCSFSKEPSIYSSQDVSLEERGGSPRIPRKSPGPVPYVRSKSTSMLYPVPPEAKNDVFSMLKERNSFDKNFPTLASKSKPTTPTSAPTTNAWKQSLETAKAKLEEKEISAAGGQKERDRSNSNSSHEGDVHLEQMRDLVPSGAPKMIRSNRGDLMVPPKKTPAPLIKSSIPHNMFSPPLVRKASSEPMLPLSPAFQEKYLKLQASKGVPPSVIVDNRPKSPVLTPPSSPTIPPRRTSISRNDFFSGLLKEEEKKKRQEAGLEPEPVETPKEIKTPQSPFSEEDEERFLRNLGWVPEEEAHVPELTEDEIKEVALKQRLADNSPKKINLENDVFSKRRTVSLTRQAELSERIPLQLY